jgi:hypothetical protein
MAMKAKILSRMFFPCLVAITVLVAVESSAFGLSLLSLLVAAPAVKTGSAPPPPIASPTSPGKLPCVP